MRQARPPRYLYGLLTAVGLLTFGTVGYVVLEGWPVFDALYMTVITLTTVGYGETHPLTPAGRIFTMALLLGGVFTIFYLATETLRGIISGEARAAWGKQLMAINLADLADHVIVVGYGRMGRFVCQEFAKSGMPFVVIDKIEDLLDDFNLPRGIPVHGDATSDETLLKAGVRRARALVAVVGSDADNLYVTMSARLLNDKLFIIARGSEERTESKLLRAGASRVVSPYVIGGNTVAQAVLRPTVLDFISLATRTEHLELQMEEALIRPGSKLEGVSLKDPWIRKELSVMIIAIKQASGQMLFNPPPETSLAAGDILIALGDKRHVDQLAKVAAGEKRAAPDEL